MKLSTISKSLLPGVALLLATAIFAADKNKGSLQIPEQVSVNGQALPAGTYTVEWAAETYTVKLGDSDLNVDLRILQGKTVVAIAPARMIGLQRSDSWDSVVEGKNQDGSRSLLEIHFGGKKYAFALGGKQARTDIGENAIK
jgi:hypothetical protein